MSKKIYQVTEVKLEIIKKLPPILVINAKGQVRTGGYSNARLEPYVYVTPPRDGIYEFDFIADEPTGGHIDVITEILAKTYNWDSFPKDLKGVKVYSETNNKTAIL